MTAPPMAILAASETCQHVAAFSAGGAHDASNFATACATCNMRKSAEPADEFQKKHPLGPIKGEVRCARALGWTVDALRPNATGLSAWCYAVSDGVA